METIDSTEAQLANLKAEAQKNSEQRKAADMAFRKRVMADAELSRKRTPSTPPPVIAAVDPGMDGGGATVVAMTDAMGNLVRMDSVIEDHERRIFRGLGISEADLRGKPRSAVASLGLGVLHAPFLPPIPDHSYRGNPFDKKTTAPVYQFGHPIPSVEAPSLKCFPGWIARALAVAGLGCLLRPVIGAEHSFYPHPKLLAAWESTAPTAMLAEERVAYMGRIKHKLLSDEPWWAKGTLPDFGYDE